MCADGVSPLPSRVEAVKDFPKPQTIRQLRKFLGLINFYHRFIPQAASKLQPLHQLCHSCPLSREVPWSLDSESAFADARSILADANLLAHPVASIPLRVSSDASDLGVGMVLEQYSHGTWLPLSFFSKHLSRAELKYSAFNRELLAAYLPVRKFQTLIEGCDCHLLIINH